MSKIIRPSFGQTYREKPVCLLAVPSHRGLLTVRLAFMFSDSALLSFKPDHPWAYAPYVPVAHRPIEYARNLCVEQMLKWPKARKIFFVDDDMIPPPDWWRLLEHGEPIVSGVTLGWQAGREAEGRLPSPLYVTYNRGTDGKWVSGPPPGDAPFWADGIGASCLSIDRAVFESMPRPWFETEYDPSDGHVVIGEDLKFFEKANKAGHRVLVDPRVVFGHEKVVDVVEVGQYARKCMDEVKREQDVRVAR